MGTHTPKFGILAGTALLLLTLSGTANAAYLNFGTLDVQPVEKNGTTANEWFVDYLKPGEKKQEQIRISNFSPEEKHLELYIADVSSNDKNSYTVRPLGQQQEDLNNWITLPTKTITLKAGESKILSVNIQTPGNAGVGLHTGGVMVRERVDGKNQDTRYAIEKGVRVYLNITGPAITQATMASLELRQSAGHISANSLVQNTGTTDYYPDFKLELQNLSGAAVAENKYDGKVKPHEEKPVTASVNKPAPGFYQIVIRQGDTSAVLGSIAIIPAWIPMLLLATILAYGLIRTPKTATKKNRAPVFAPI
jgi:hypothetical protein